MKKTLIVTTAVISIGVTGFVLTRPHGSDREAAQADSMIAQNAPCTYRGNSYPHGTRIEGRRCNNGTWE